ncbi:hypothetical protein PIB30_031261 [Stylosanthes scabra]|uniref:Uncharacterized protein n=1 Tax=Stylosanthes scabra TaxID=79078 RepID=A0ABU6XCP4_9FABA|nr:hypothetical protein [Stylosanthes scabra]
MIHPCNGAMLWEKTLHPDILPPPHRVRIGRSTLKRRREEERENVAAKEPNQDTNSGTQSSIVQVVAEASQTTNKPARRPTGQKPNPAALKNRKFNLSNPKPFKNAKATTASQGERSTESNQPPHSNIGS